MPVRVVVVVGRVVVVVIVVEAVVVRVVVVVVIVINSSSLYYFFKNFHAFTKRAVSKDYKKPLCSHLFHVLIPEQHFRMLLFKFAVPTKKEMTSYCSLRDLKCVSFVSCTPHMFLRIPHNGPLRRKL